MEEELRDKTLGADVPAERVPGLRLAALLHDVAKPVTRGEVGGRVVFVAHDSLGALVVRRACSGLGATAEWTDAAATLTALHLKIGFMRHERTDYPPERLIPAAGPFGEELAVLSLADRLAAQGPRLEDRHLERHRDLCAAFLGLSRGAGPHPLPDYGALATELPAGVSDADVGYAAFVRRLLVAGGAGEPIALRHAVAAVSPPAAPS